MPRNNLDVLVVGAGCAGAVVAERLASHGQRVLIIDKRPYIGGKACDEYDAHGILVHRYGPHIFHTQATRVVAYRARFTAWHRYEHRVPATVAGACYPLPINQTTSNRLDPLRVMVQNICAPRGTLVTLESAIDGISFVPRDRAASRARVGLPAAPVLIGTAGALDTAGGTEVLNPAYTQLRAERDVVALAVAGSLRHGVPLPAAPAVHALGELAHDAIPHFFSALDVAVICPRDGAFGRYAFPQKLYEIIGSGVPLVAARVGAVAATLAAFPQALSASDDAASALRALRGQLQQPRPIALTPPTWTAHGARLARLLDRVVGDH